MKHHPDTATITKTGTTGTATSSSATSTADKTSTNSNVHHDFVRIRTAYEQIRNEHNRRQLRQPPTTANTTKNQQTTTDRNKDDTNDMHSDSSFTLFTVEEEKEFLDWFYDMSNVRITPLQRKEMVTLYWKQSKLHEIYPGGPFWDFARRLVTFQDAFLQNREKQKNQSTTTTTTESKKTKNDSIHIRRKRRPRGR